MNRLARIRWKPFGRASSTIARIDGCRDARARYATRRLDKCPRDWRRWCDPVKSHGLSAISAFAGSPFVRVADSC